MEPAIKLFYKLIFLSDKTKSIKITVSVSEKAVGGQAKRRNAGKNIFVINLFKSYFITPALCFSCEGRCGIYYQIPGGIP